jgi:hypothetical protein
MSTNRLSIVCLATMLLVASAAFAQGAPAPAVPAPAAPAQATTTPAQRVAIARLTFEGKIPVGLQELFSQRLVQGLSAAHFEVLGGTDVQQRLTGPNQTLASCQNSTCYPAMAYALGASYLITADIAESNKTYIMVLEIINGRTGGVLASNRDRCETCGAEEAGEKMGLAASALRERLEVVSRAPARIVIRSRPPGATVVIDGRQIGATPLDVEMPGGPHHAQLFLRDHDPSSRSFTVVSGVDETLDMELVAIPPTFPYRTVGWSTVGGGAALILAGVLTMSFDNSEVSCGEADKDPYGHCPYVRSTNWWAASLLGLGVAAATVGGFFLYLAPPAPSAPARASIGISGRF